MKWALKTFSFFSVLRSRPISAAPAPTLSKILRLRLRLLAPAPGHFQKPINQKFKVMIFFIKNEKKWMIVLRGQNKNLKETWIRYHILKNLLVMEVFLLDNYRSRSWSRSRKRDFFSAPAPAKNYGSGSATLGCFFINPDFIPPCMKIYLNQGGQTKNPPKKKTKKPT